MVDAFARALLAGGGDRRALAPLAAAGPDQLRGCVAVIACGLSRDAVRALARARRPFVVVAAARRRPLRLGHAARRRRRQRHPAARRRLARHRRPRSAGWPRACEPDDADRARHAPAGVRAAGRGREHAAAAARHGRAARPARPAERRDHLRAGPRRGRRGPRRRARPAAPRGWPTWRSPPAPEWRCARPGGAFRRASSGPRSRTAARSLVLGRAAVRTALTAECAVYAVGTDDPWSPRCEDRVDPRRGAETVALHRRRGQRGRQAHGHAFASRSATPTRTRSASRTRRCRSSTRSSTSGPRRLPSASTRPGPTWPTRMRREGVPLFTLESWRPVREFDLLGVTLQAELTYSNVLETLDLAGIPLRSADRGDDDPIVMAGGPSASNPEPLAPFVDVFFMGEAEEGLLADPRRAGAGAPRAASASTELARLPVPVRAGARPAPRRPRGLRVVRHLHPAVAARRALRERDLLARQRRGHARLHPRLPLLPRRHLVPAGARAGGGRRRQGRPASSSAARATTSSRSRRSPRATTRASSGPSARSSARGRRCTSHCHPTGSTRGRWR